MKVDFGQRLGVCPHLSVDVGWSLVASSGSFSSLEHGGHQMLGSSSRGLLDPEHGENRLLPHMRHLPLLPSRRPPARTMGLCRR
jgi:hypothetical protein